jgi:hypothetical protein
LRSPCPLRLFRPSSSAADRRHGRAQPLYVRLRHGLSEEEELVVDGFWRGADLTGHALGLLVIGEHLGEQEADDKNGAGNKAWYEPIEGDEFEAQLVDPDLEREKDGDDRRDAQQQAKMFPITYAAAVLARSALPGGQARRASKRGRRRGCSAQTVPGDGRKLCRFDDGLM